MGSKAEGEGGSREGEGLLERERGELKEMARDEIKEGDLFFKKNMVF